MASQSDLGDEFYELEWALVAAHAWQSVVDGKQIAPFDVAAVAAVDLYDPGYNDGPPLFAVGRLHDGRWFAVEAWRDYTGWGCQDGGDVRVGPSREAVIRYGLSKEGRHVLGVPLEDEDE